MAIAYASTQQIQRARGHKALDRLAYILRQQILWPRTGEKFDYSERPDLAASATLVPPGCASIGAVELWTAVEAATDRANGVLGFELLLALPTPDELSIEQSVHLVKAFIGATIVNRHNLAATLAVHEAHGLTEEASDEVNLADGPNGDSFDHLMTMARANRHCHIMVTPSQMTRAGLAKRRYTALDPCLRAQKVYGRDWGRLWGHFQNSYFAENGLDLRVTSNPPVSLKTVPLKVVRRARRHQVRTNPGTSGRSLLVNKARETENRGQLLDIEPALACFTAPFSRNELSAFFQRHFADDIARELEQAAIGLGGCVELDVHAPGEWFASAGQVQAEMAAFGRALMLAKPSAAPINLSTLMATGFDPMTKAVIEAALTGDDLTIIRTYSPADILARDIAGIAQRVDRKPVVVTTAAGHPLPEAIIRTPADLRTKMVSRAIIILDDVDALDAPELSTVLAAALGGGNKIVFLRRMDSDWPRLELIDLIAAHTNVYDWQMPILRAEPRAALKPAQPSVEPKWHAPRTGIVLPPKGVATSLECNWPRLGIDMDDAVLTAPAAIGAAIRFFATAPDDVDWHLPELDLKRGETQLVQRLTEWAGDLTTPPSPPKPGKDWGDEVSPDALSLEEDAFATLEDDYSDLAADDDPDPDASYSDDRDWSEDMSDTYETDFDTPFEPE